MNTYQVDRKQWQQMSILEQMGNIGSEVGRSIKAKKRDDQSAYSAALIRALDLFDATVESLVQQKSARTREVLRAKEQYLQLFYGGQDAFNDAAKLENYFMQFAIAARSGH